MYVYKKPQEGFIHRDRVDSLSENREGVTE